MREAFPIHMQASNSSTADTALGAESEQSSYWACRMGKTAVAWRFPIPQDLRGSDQVLLCIGYALGT